MRCAECICESPSFDLSGLNGRENVIKHYLEQHPKSERLHDVIEGTFAVVECRDCWEEFWSPVEVNNGNLLAESYCSDCIEDNYVRQLVVQKLSVEEYVRLEGSPPGDSATKQGGDDGAE